MRNVKKRQCTLSDVSLLKNNGSSKKLKHQGLLFTHQSLINWREVKITLDATVVKKYLNNKKSNSKIITSSPKNDEQKSGRKKNLAQYSPQANKKISKVFSEKSNVMVKLELPDDFQFNNLMPKENFNFEIKKENHDSVEDNIDFGNDNEFAASIQEDFQYQINETHALAEECVVEGVFKSEGLESDSGYEEVSISREFKQEEVIPNYENTEKINQESNAPSSDTTTPKIRRSNRERKKRRFSDDYDCEIVKRRRSCSRINKKLADKAPVKESHSKSDSRTLPKTNPNVPIASASSPKPARKRYKLYFCDHCDYKTAQKSRMPNHIVYKHLRVIFDETISCSHCKKTFTSMRGLMNHRRFCLMRLLMTCKFCSVYVESKDQMNEHLKIVHADKMAGKTFRQFADDVWLDTVTDVIKAMEREGNTTNITDFGKTFLRIKKYYLERKEKLTKLYCAECKLCYKDIKVQTITHCLNCMNQLLYQCQNCKITASNCQAIWKHFLNKGSRCDISEHLNFSIDIERSNMTNRGSKVVKSLEQSQKYYNCELCDYKGSTKLEIYRHILYEHAYNDDADNKEDSNMQKTTLYAEKSGRWTCSKCNASYDTEGSWEKHKKKRCDICVRLPCKFCPLICLNSVHLKNHVSAMHVDELDGIHMKDVVNEVVCFKNMMTVRFGDCFKETTDAGETSENSGCCLNGIQSMLKPRCLHCTTTALQRHKQCVNCYKNLIFQCLQCDIRFSKYSAAWEHITKFCMNRMLTLNVREEKSSFEWTAQDLSPALHCDHCDFKKAAKSVLNRHTQFKRIKQPSVISDSYVCDKCWENFGSWEEFSHHKINCRAQFIYNCHFCSQSRSTFENMEKHVIQKQAYLYCRKDGKLDEEFNEIMKKIEDCRKITSKRGVDGEFMDYSSFFSRSFSETVKLVSFHCYKCDESFDNILFESIEYTKKCPRCQSRLAVVCKNCSRVYSAWRTVAIYLRETLCKQCCFEKPKVPRYLIDHSYARNKLTTETLDMIIFES